ncbi:MAG: putative enzyme related to lactoylglutathione lyase [Arenicella sp.]|jgi:predicted enzyme related to lactoylglutathione lyase
MNAVNWFEIPTIDLERAKGFYSEVFGLEMEYVDAGESKMYMFTGQPEAAGSVGAIFQHEKHKPSAVGTVVYFSTADTETEVNKVEANGGSIVFGKTSIGPNGFIAQVIDSEGNRIGIHSQQ